MYGVSEQDLETLESFLDDALSPLDAEHLRVRLAAEPELAGALEVLQGERAARTAVWEAAAPSEAQAAAFARRTIVAVRRESRRRWIIKALATSAAAVACFLGGWIMRGAAVTDLQVTDARGTGTVATAHPPAAPVAPAGSFQVALTDAAGNVLAVQQFTNLEEAQAFAADLTQWRAQQHEIREGQMLLVADEF